MYVFIDESGDLGFDFKKKGKPSNFFLVGALKVSEEKQLNRVIKRHRKRLKKKKEEKKEVKFSNTSPENRKRILEDISKIELEAFIIYIDKHNAYPRIKDDPLRMYSYLLKILSEKCFSKPITEDTTIVLDRSFSKVQQETLELYLRTQNENLLKSSSKISVHHLQSERTNGLLCIDFICGAVMQKLMGNNSYFDIIKEKIKCFHKLY